MLVAAIETSSLRGSVALFLDRECVEEEEFPSGLVYGREITARLGQVLARRGLAAGDLDGLAVDVGPGSYTGCRVGVTAAKTLAFALRIPVVAVSSLEVLAAAAAEHVQSGDFAEAPVLVPVLDGRRGYFYAARFSAEPGGVRRRAADAVGRAVDLAEGLPPSAWVFADGASDFLAALRELGRDDAPRRGPAEWDLPSARVLGRLALPRLAAAALGDEIVHGLDVVYLRPSDPEIVWSERDRSTREARSKGMHWRTK